MLPKEITERIHEDAYNFGQKKLETGFSTTVAGQKEAYIAGAYAEAERSQKLVEALEEIIKMGNAGKTLSHIDSQVSAFARKALTEYNQQP